MKEDFVILVDEKDKKIGLKEKVAAHLGEDSLHRAFMFFIFDDRGRLFLQKRSKDKMLWPLYWDTGASHPRVKEDYESVGMRRLKEELGFSCQLENIGKFQYKSRYKNIGSENEICAVLAGRYNGVVNPNPGEIAEWKWIEIKSLKKEITKNPQHYTPWLKIGLKVFLKERKGRFLK